MNDLSLNWKRISIGLPRTKNSSNDRAPTVEEIRKVVEYPDRRIKSIVYSMASGGFRLGTIYVGDMCRYMRRERKL
jgi:hypothetical protein